MLLMGNNKLRVFETILKPQIIMKKEYLKPLIKTFEMTIRPICTSGGTYTGQSGEEGGGIYDDDSD